MRSRRVLAHQVATAALLVEDMKRSNKGHAFRVCGPVIAGPFDAVVLEIEFKNLNDYETFWTERAATPGYAEFRNHFWQLTAPGGYNELWEIAE